jgi:cyclic pyranopterin phosphate synthase
VWEGSDAARRAGLAPIKINVVAMRGINDDEFGDFARLTMQHDLAVRFIELMPIGRTALAEPQRWVSESQIRRMIASLGPLSPAEPDAGLGPARLYRLSGARGKIGFISAISSPFCWGCNRLRLTADGHLRACLFDGHEVSIAHLLRPVVDQAGLRRALLDCIHAKPRVHGPVGSAQMSRVGG